MRNFDLRKFLAENRVVEQPVEEMASTSKLLNHEDYQFALEQLKHIVKKPEAFNQVKKLLTMVGELGLDIGYAEALGDQDAFKNYDADKAKAAEPKVQKLKQDLGLAE